MLCILREFIWFCATIGYGPTTLPLRNLSFLIVITLDDGCEIGYSFLCANSAPAC